MKNFYKTKGWAQRIARHHIFENLTMAIIIIYAVYMSIDADFNEATIITETNPVFIVCEQLGAFFCLNTGFRQFFCFYFFFELLIRP